MPTWSPRADALRRQVVREPVRARVELRVGHDPVADDERHPIGDGVDGVLDEVGDVPGHATSKRCRRRSQLPSAPASALRRPFGGAREHLLDYRADGCDLEARVPVPAQRRARDRRVPRRPPGPACARRPHRRGPCARPAARVRPRHRRRGRRPGRGRGSRRRDTSAWVAEPLRKHPLDRPFAWALVQLDGADTRDAARARLGLTEAAAPGTRVRIRWADETEGKITDIACFELRA